MLKENDKMDDLFAKFENQWDIQEPDANHYDRFLAKQHGKKSKNNRWQLLSIAASVVLLAGLFTFFNYNNNHQSKNELEFASTQTRETDSIFTAMIKIELEKVKERKSPQNEQIVKDALVQMKALDDDYEKIKAELIKNGESKQIIHAMIRNFKTRISFLENVLTHIEENEKIKNTTDENTI